MALKYLFFHCTCQEGPGFPGGLICERKPANALAQKFASTNLIFFKREFFFIQYSILVPKIHQPCALSWPLQQKQSTWSWKKLILDIFIAWKSERR